MIFILIRRIEKFTTDKELAVGFKFIENETDIEVSIDNQNWIPLDIYNNKSQIHIFQGFQELQIVKVYYRYKINQEIFNNYTKFQMPFKNKKTPISELNIPIDFKIRHKSGCSLPKEQIVQLEEN